MKDYAGGMLLVILILGSATLIVIEGCINKKEHDCYSENPFLKKLKLADPSYTETIATLSASALEWDQTHDCICKGR